MTYRQAGANLAAAVHEMAYQLGRPFFALLGLHEGNVQPWVRWRMERDSLTGAIQ